MVHIDTDNISAASLNSHWGQYNPTFPILQGCGSLFSQYGTGYIPHTIILDTEGIVRGNWVGWESNVGSQMASVIEQFASISHPAMSIQNLELSGDANGDGRPDPGETLDMDLNLGNNGIAVDATNITATMTCNDAGITVNSDMVTFPDCPAGGTSLGDAMFNFSVDEGVDPFYATFDFQISSDYDGSDDPYIELLQTQIRIGRPDVLIVDSDGTEENNESFLTAALNSRDEGHDVWDTQAYGGISAEELNRYSRVYWLGGSNTSDLMVSEASALASYLDNGGELMMSSQYATDNPDNAQFLQDYFHVSLEQDLGVTTFLLEGTEGDPFFGGSNFVITGSGGASNNEHPDRLTVSDGATSFATWLQGGGSGGVYVDNGVYKAMYLGFPVEASRTHSSYPGSLTMDTFLDRAENFFSGNTAVGEEHALAQDFRIKRAWPNPFNPSTRISFTLPQSAKVSFAVFNTLGQQVTEIAAGELASGSHDIVFNAASLSSGLYFVQLKANGEARDLIKLSLVK